MENNIRTTSRLGRAMHSRATMLPMYEQLPLPQVVRVPVRPATLGTKMGWSRPVPIRILATFKIKVRDMTRFGKLVTPTEYVTSFTYDKVVQHGK